MEKLSWEVTERIEVLRELTSEVLVMYENYLLSNKIPLSDEKNIIVKIYFSLSKANKELLSCNTTSEVDMIEGKFLLGKEIFDALSIE